MDNRNANLLYPWDEGFWEIYHSNLPPGSHISPFYIVDPYTLELRNVEDKERIDYVEGGALDHVEEYWACA